ncbi:MAG: hypothetical protein AB7V26_02930 [Lysobacterales bacterium]
MSQLRRIFSGKPQPRGWPTVTGYLREVFWLSALVGIVADLIVGQPGRAWLYLKMMYIFVVPIYTVRIIVELRGRLETRLFRWHERVIGSIAGPLIFGVLAATPWLILYGAAEMKGRAHLVHQAMNNSLVGLVILGAIFSYGAAMLIAVTIIGIPRIWQSQNRR